MYKKDASNGLSYDKMNHSYILNHPHDNEEEYDQNGHKTIVSKKYSVWKTKTGRFDCRARHRESELKEFGTGIVVLFQFLKALFLIFFIGFIFNLPAMAYFYSANPFEKASDIFKPATVI